ncbi:MAG TPA: hypothetical protein VF733_05295 [Candidatus Saccharimonadales bacterium]
MSSFYLNPEQYTPPITVEGFIEPIVDQRTTLQKTGSLIGKIMITGSFAGMIYSGYEAATSFVEAANNSTSISAEVRSDAFSDVYRNTLNACGYGALGVGGGLVLDLSRWKQKKTKS